MIKKIAIYLLEAVILKVTAYIARIFINKKELEKIEDDTDATKQKYKDAKTKKDMEREADDLGDTFNS